MPVINLRIDDQTRQLWVEAANGEHVTLSEWIRRACDQRLGLADRYVDAQYQPTLEEQAYAAHASDPDHRESVEDLYANAADDTITADDIRQAQQFLRQTAGNQVGAGTPSPAEPESASTVSPPAPTHTAGEPTATGITTSQPEGVRHIHPDEGGPQKAHPSPSPAAPREFKPDFKDPPKPKKRR